MKMKEEKKKEEKDDDEKTILMMLIFWCAISVCPRLAGPRLTLSSATAAKADLPPVQDDGRGRPRLTRVVTSSPTRKAPLCIAENGEDDYNMLKKIHRRR